MVTEQMQRAHLDLAKQLIELKHNVKITSIEFEDGSGKSFNITTSGWTQKQYVRL
jgi:hypothetical protein